MYLLKRIVNKKKIFLLYVYSGSFLDVVLWDERAISFPAEQVHQDGQNSPQIIIFVGALVKTYAGVYAPMALPIPLHLD
jgi:hypothetical protein